MQTNIIHPECPYGMTSDEWFETLLPARPDVLSDCYAHEAMEYAAEWKAAFEDDAEDVEANAAWNRTLTAAEWQERAEYTESGFNQFA